MFALKTLKEECGAFLSFSSLVEVSDCRCFFLFVLRLSYDEKGRKPGGK